MAALKVIEEQQNVGPELLKGLLDLVCCRAFDIDISDAPDSGSIYKREPILFRKHGTVVTWGHSTSGGNTSSAFEDERLIYMYNLFCTARLC